MASDPTASPPAPGALDGVVVELEDEEAGFFAAYDRLPHAVKLGAVVVVALAVAIALAIGHDAYWHWFEVHTGTVNETGPYYGFWSGFGSDLGEATLVAGGVALWRHHSCHVRGCARLGRPVDGTPYLACPKHHPAHHGDKRAVSLATILREHERSAARGQPPGPGAPVS
jgi:hypothetical protein